MKFRPYFQLLFSLLLFAGLAACGSTQNATAGKGRQVDYSSMNTLADALRTQNGLQVVGNANNTKVTIRGVSTGRSSKSTTYVQQATAPGPAQKETSVITDVEPLFVIDKTIVGNSYETASRAVNVQDISSIKVLKSYSETNSYGESGKNGVILITTKMAAGK